MNLIVLMGRLTRDPELKYLPSGNPHVRCGLAVNRRVKKADGSSVDKTLYIDIEAYAANAELIAKYMTKGRRILIRGFLEFDAWDDRVTGQQRQKHKVVIEQFTFMDQPPEHAEYPHANNGQGRLL